MTIEIIESSAGANFVFSKGQKIYLSDFSDKTAAIEIMKEQVRCGYAIDITGKDGDKIERKVKSAIETR